MNIKLDGPQDTSVSPHLSETPDAVIGLRVGGALIWMNDRSTVTAFAEVWRLAQRDSLLLPRRPARDDTVLVGEPTVTVEESGAPPAWARVLRPAGRPSSMRVLLGSLLFDVHDLRAFHSTLRAFRCADEIADQVFRTAPGEARSRWSTRVAGAAFISPVDSSHQRSVRERVLPPASRRDPAAPRARREDQAR